MRKLLLALALLGCSIVSANAAAAFWSPNVTGGGGASCNNGTFKWDADSGTGGAAHKCWATTTGGTTAAAAPGATDSATFDGSSGGGTITVGAGYNPSLSNLTWGAFTGTLDFNTNNNNLTIAVAFNGSGSGTRTWKNGTGTITLTGSSSGLTVWTVATTTGLTLSPTASTFSMPIVIANSAVNTYRIFATGGLTYSSLSLSDTNSGALQIGGGGATFTTFNITGAPTTVWFPSSLTTTITNLISWNGGGVTTPLLIAGGTNGTQATLALSSASSPTLSYVNMRDIAISNTGSTYTFNNSINYGNVTCSSCTATFNAPSAGGTSQVIGGGL